MDLKLHNFFNNIDLMQKLIDKINLPEGKNAETSKAVPPTIIIELLRNRLPTRSIDNVTNT